MRVLVLMSTYNGAKYVEQQIDSILNQKNVDVFLLIRDDGSMDETISIINRYKDSGRVFLYSGKNKGPAFSFMDLMVKAKNEYNMFDYYAFADQDDFWERNKLIEAIKILENMSLKYRLYASALKIVDEHLNLLSIPVIEEYSFPEYMFRNQCAGCTMVFNYDIVELMSRYLPTYLEMHDIWLLRVVHCVSDSEVYVDKKSYICYRQHDNNVVGANHGIMHVINLKARQLLCKNEVGYKTSVEIINGYKEIIKDREFEFLNMVIESKKSLRKRYELICYVCKFRFSNFMRKVFFIWNAICNNV